MFFRLCSFSLMIWTGDPDLFCEVKVRSSLLAIELLSRPSCFLSSATTFLSFCLLEILVLASHVFFLGLL